MNLIMGSIIIFFHFIKKMPNNKYNKQQDTQKKPIKRKTDESSEEE